jgi:hypothetical protein
MQIAMHWHRTASTIESCRPHPIMKLDKVTPIANTMAKAFDGGTRTE